MSDAQGLGISQVFCAGIAAISGKITRRLTIAGYVTLKEWDQANTISWIAIFNNHIQNQPTCPAGQRQLVAILNVSPPFDDDVGMWLEQADDLVPRWDPFTVDDAPLGLRNDLHDQRAIVLHLGLPSLRIWLFFNDFMDFFQITKGVERYLK